ncbi:MAG TPA: HNH endonuclease [Longimicrobium sp.]
MATARNTGALLNDLWDVRAAHALFIHDGHWYHKLRKFPGALFDINGYIKFETEEEYLSCSHLQIRKQISVPGRISSIPGYVRVGAFAEALGRAVTTAETFDPDGIEDARQRTAQALVQRQGQPVFRSRLLNAYAHACCITGTDVVAALEAAHIYPYRGKLTNHPSNGLLLRSDLHTLFDCGLLGVDEKKLTVILAPSLSTSLSTSSYSNLFDLAIRLPKRNSDAPSPEALKWHRRTHGL